jgi:hypothetical protein
MAQMIRIGTLIYIDKLKINEEFMFIHQNNSKINNVNKNPTI